MVECASLERMYTSNRIGGSNPLLSAMNDKKPLIGIVLDREEGGGYSEYPYYVLREHYFNAVRKAGAIPIGLDIAIDGIADYVKLCDGLVMAGCDYDIPPAMYGETTVH